MRQVLGSATRREKQGCWWATWVKGYKLVIILGEGDLGENLRFGSATEANEAEIHG